MCPKTVDKTTETDKMALSNFDLKTAISLLPIMTGQEQVTTQLIDSIQLYGSMLNDDAKKQMIEFVLKTRLSASAKLRLKSSYATVESLLKDMRTHLIQKKSAVALQSQMFTARQGRRSIEKFGSDLEELFVNLTLAQADGDEQKYDVLRPLNEKVAVKRFADGLNNSRLSTIIASRPFQSLPEAIRAAVDENSLAPSEEQVMQFNRNRGMGRSIQRTRGNSKSASSSTYNSQGNQSRTFHNSTTRSYLPRVRGKPTRGSTRARGHQPYHSRHVSYVQNSQNTENVECTQNAPDTLEFFRSFNK